MTQYKGELAEFPVEVVEKMLQRQVDQGNPRDVSIFEKDKSAGSLMGGFTWAETSENHVFWADIIRRSQFQQFFEKYPKTEYPATNDNEYPKVMLVSNDTIIWNQRVVFMEKNGEYLCRHSARTFEEAKASNVVCNWKYAKELPPPKMKLTKENLIQVFPCFAFDALDCFED